MSYLPQIFVKARCIINGGALHNQQADSLSAPTPAAFSNAADRVSYSAQTLAATSAHSLEVSIELDVKQAVV